VIAQNLLQLVELGYAAQEAHLISSGLWSSAYPGKTTDAYLALKAPGCE
jgi:hypothetical protein